MNKLKFILISPKNRTAYNFRGDLIKDIIAKGYEVIVTGPNKDGVDRIEELGARFIEVPMNKNGLNPVADIKYLWRLRKIMKRERVNVSLGYTIKPFLYGAIAAKMAGVKNINSMVAGAGYLFASKTIKARLIRLLTLPLYRIGFGCANHVIFQNSDDLNEFVDKGLVKRDKCSVVDGSGVNMTKYIPAPYPEIPSFFFLGRLVHSKGGLDFAKAAKIVKTNHPKSRFMILGKLEKDLPDAILPEELMPYVDDGTIELFPETDNIPQYYAMTSVFVLPTAYREGTPRVILEAMASARAIITTNTPGCKETVVDGENGFFTAIHNPKDLADKMLYFILNPEKVSVFGNCSYDICKRKYEVSITNKRMFEIMQI